MQKKHLTYKTNTVYMQWSDESDNGVSTSQVNSKCPMPPPIRIAIHTQALYAMNANINMYPINICKMCKSACIRRNVLQNGGLLKAKESCDQHWNNGNE